MSKSDSLAIIGAGAMGAAFARGVLAAGVYAKDKIILSDSDEAKGRAVSGELGVRYAQTNHAAVEDASVVLLAVKPNVVGAVAQDIKDALKSDAVIVSIAAGVTIEKLSSALKPETAIVRAMPNTPCQIGAGAVGFSRGSGASDDQVQKARILFEAVGLAMEVPERLLNAVTGLSGSGPAYTFLFVEALSDAGVAAGLPRDLALALASQTVAGSAKLVVDSGLHPAQLKDQVTSPGGTTIAGIAALEKGGVRAAVMSAVAAAVKRAEELA
jgi:pyrroline-5-carboxylate reductase